MGWIKRNLFFVFGGLTALVLLGAAGFYDYQSWNHNSTAFDSLNEIYGNLNQLNEKKPSPGNAKIDNIETAREQEQEVRYWIGQTGNYFVPIAPIPAPTADEPEVTSESFADDLRRTIDQLQHEAEAASVQLPPQYGFSFEEQRSIVRFAPGSLDPLAVQLGEVKAISEIFFAARVNSLDNIQRARVSDDDLAGPAADYLGEVSVTNDLAVLTPYVIMFRSFSPELASVLAGLAASPHGFIVKAVNVAPAGAASQAMAQPYPGGGHGMPNPYYPGGGPGMPNPYYPGGQPGMSNPNYPNYREGGPGMPGLESPPPNEESGRGGLPTVLQEQLLAITLEVVIVKPLPGK